MGKEARGVYALALDHRITRAKTCDIVISWVNFFTMAVPMSVHWRLELQYLYRRVNGLIYMVVSRASQTG
jgi:hypothetical protein